MEGLFGAPTKCAVDFLTKRSSRMDPKKRTGLTNPFHCIPHSGQTPDTTQGGLAGYQMMLHSFCWLGVLSWRGMTAAL